MDSVRTTNEPFLKFLLLFKCGDYKTGSSLAFLCLHPQILFLASEKSVVDRNVLLVEDSQGGLPDISGTLTLLMGLGFSSQSSRPAGRARSAG